jgi:hypothetical protein
VRLGDEDIVLFGIIVQPERFTVTLDRATGSWMRGDILDQLIEFIDIGSHPF